MTLNEGQCTDSDEEYKKIIPTAWLTAYPRIFSDIPLSQEIFHQLENIRTNKGEPEISQDLKVSRLAPEIEARYKLVTRLLYQSNIPQILEIAAGLSPRGLLMTKSPSIKYVEMELPDMIAMKKEVIAKLLSESKINTVHNLYLEEGNALNLKDLFNAARHFEKRPIAVVHEGLLRYLNFKEKAVVAQNIHLLLETFGGVWITPDITLKKLLETQNKFTMPGKNEEIISLTGRNINENRFEDEMEAKTFFEGLGFTVERHSALEVQKELTSPQKLKLSNEVEGLIDSCVVFVMRIRVDNK